MEGPQNNRGDWFKHALHTGGRCKACCQASSPMDCRRATARAAPRGAGACTGALRPVSWAHAPHQGPFPDQEPRPAHPHPKASTAMPKPSRVETMIKEAARGVELAPEQSQPVSQEHPPPLSVPKLWRPPPHTDQVASSPCPAYHAGAPSFSPFFATGAGAGIFSPIWPTTASPSPIPSNACNRAFQSGWCEAEAEGAAASRCCCFQARFCALAARGGTTTGVRGEADVPTHFAFDGSLCIHIHKARLPKGSTMPRSATCVARLSDRPTQRTSTPQE